jgi:uncharacterized DUF497 family protein
MTFEFNRRKSISNKSKHGLDFIEGKALWDDPDRLVIPAKTVDEPRFMIIGHLAGAVWSGIFTIRDENIKIISIRRSRKEEIDLYESERI